MHILYTMPGGAMFVIHILVRKEPISPMNIRGGRNCILASRRFTQPEPLLAHGQQFVQGLGVDVSFGQGSKTFLDVTYVRCGEGVVEVFFDWEHPTGQVGHAAYALENLGYQLHHENQEIEPKLGCFTPR